MGKYVWVGQSKSLVSKQIIVSAFSRQIICFPYRKVWSAVTDWCICSPLLQGTDPEWRWLAEYNEDTGWAVGHVTLTPCRNARSGAGLLLEEHILHLSKGCTHSCPGLRTLSSAAGAGELRSWLWKAPGAAHMHLTPPHLWERYWNAAVHRGEDGILDPKSHRLHWKGPLWNLFSFRGGHFLRGHKF